MKDSFIHQTVTFVKAHAHVGKKVIVVPSKRAELYFNRALYQSTIQVIQIDDWVKQQLPASTKVVDKSELILAFFESYAAEHPEDAVLEDFMKWASTAIDDFNAIDQARVDAKQLYNYLTDTKAIDLWNPEQTSLTSNQLKYLQFFKSQHHLYVLFHQTLVARNWATKATAINYLIDSLLNTLTDECFYLAGFNVLTNGQKNLFELLNKAGRAKFIWDTDSYYLNETSNEAGNHIRENLLAFGQANSVIFQAGVTKIDTPNKEISLIASSRQLPQAKYLYQLLNGFSEEELNSTAIIATNENLLPAILSSLPEKVKNVNVSLSYPIKNLTVFQWAVAYLNFLGSVKNATEETPRYYFRTLIEWLNSPMSRRVFNKVDELIQVVMRYNVPYLTPAKIIQLGEVTTDDLLATFIRGAQKPEEVIALLIQFYTELKLRLAEDEKLLMEELDAVADFFKQLEVQFESDFFKEHVNIKALRKIMEQGASSLSLSYKGQPLKGLQILSLLETNCLAFDRVIILGCNEGLLPKSLSHHSFIPYDVRRVFNLPLPAFHDAMYAYSFYRLLQHPDKVYLLYDTDADSFGSGEMSRYLLQLKNELKHTNLHESIAMFDNVSASVAADVVLENKPELQENIHHFITERGITPTALSTYVTCSLKFFYRYVIRLKEEEEVEEFLGADMLGKLVHRTLELLYKPYVKQVLNADTLTAIKSKLNECFQQACIDCDVLKLAEDGKNLLLLNIAKQYVNMFLTYEAEYIESIGKLNQLITLDSLEARLKAVVPMNIQGSQVDVFLTGFADRIDRMGEVTRILDFKTGTVDQRKLVVADFDDLFLSQDYSKALQLLHYSYMMNKMQPNSKIQSGIISFRSISKGLQVADFSKLNLSDQELFQTYEERIMQFVNDLKNPATEFRMTDDREQCEYCSFNALCQRN